MYAYFEAILENDTQRDQGENIDYLQIHKPSGFGMNITLREDLKDMLQSDVTKPFHYMEENVITEFWDKLRSLACSMDEKEDEFHVMEDISIGDPDIDHKFEFDDTCWICKRDIDISDDDGDDEGSEFNKVRDHCHWTGRYRGPAHNRCNLGLQYKSFIPVFMHNLTGYDMHFLIQSLHTVDDVERPNILAKSVNKLMSVTISFTGIRHKIAFVDSLNFFQGSLEKLTSNLVKKSKGVN